MAAEQADVVRPRVIIANINRGQILAQTAAGIIQSLTSGRALSVALSESGPYLDDGRNRVVDHALQSPVEWEWLLFVDSDIEFMPDHIDTLLAPTLHEAFDPRLTPVIGGIYKNPFPDVVQGDAGINENDEGRIGPVVYEWVEVTDLMGDLNGIPTWTLRRIGLQMLEDLPPYSSDWHSVCEVACVGTGFLAIHRDLLTAMRAKYGEPLPFFDEPVINGVHYGEDMGFCLRVRDMGYPVLVNRACTVPHHKTIKLI